MDKKVKFEAVKNVLETIFTSQKILRTLAPEYSWSGLGNLLGDYGECQAIAKYNLVKAKTGSQGHDATTKEGKSVAIKATNGKKQIGFRGEADLMLALNVDDKGVIEEIYFGPFSIVLQNSNYSKTDEKRTIPVSKLRKLQIELNDKKKLLEIQSHARSKSNKVK